jgi:hypothetical protein
MHKYFGIIACMLILSCKEASKRVNFTADYHFVTQHQNDQLDHQVGPVVVAYQELIKGLNQNDTIYIQQMASQMAQITDSLSRLNLNLDVNRQRIWADGLGNLNAELQGVQMADKINGMDEVKMSIHMCGLQLLYLLAQIGYKEHQVYIFNVEDPNAEDGFVWLSLQKKDRDPFHPQNRKEIIAQEVLQELK